MVKSRFWFPAKEYGWGWGAPSSWQGWLVIAVYVCCVTFVTVVLFQMQHRITLGQHLALLAVMTLGLILICGLKGEPPRWRWGKD